LLQLSILAAKEQVKHMATIDPIAGSAIWNGFVAVIEAVGMNSDIYVIIYNSSDNIK
jgi:hypothetical protein